MIVNEHTFVLGRCMHCGAKQETGYTEGRTCVPREDHAERLAPEPARRELACEAADFIGARMREIAAERQPRCPLYAVRTLYECLRAAGRCGESCPHQADWIGPQPE